MIELGSRERTQPAPAHVVWRSLAQPRDPATRHWLTLLHDEIEPRIIQSAEPSLVVWSSLWPDRTDLSIRFDLTPDELGCRLRWTLLASPPPPDASKLGHLRYRLNLLINQGLRQSYGQ